eukprot:scaffold1066_cov421-Prasinococcus_capsulatus_cf.AAC.8
MHSDSARLPTFAGLAPGRPSRQPYQRIAASHRGVGGSEVRARARAAESCNACARRCGEEAARRGAEARRGRGGVSVGPAHGRDDGGRSKP